MKWPELKSARIGTRKRRHAPGARADATLRKEPRTRAAWVRKRVKRKMRFRPSTWVTVQTGHMGDTHRASSVIEGGSRDAWTRADQMSERVKFIAAYLEYEASFADLCRDFCVSRKTGYKWFLRYEEGDDAVRVSDARPRSLGPTGPGCSGGSSPSSSPRAGVAVHPTAVEKCHPCARSDLWTMFPVAPELKWPIGGRRRSPARALFGTLAARDTLGPSAAALRDTAGRSP
jgi:hypothetical protein